MPKKGSKKARTEICTRLNYVLLQFDDTQRI